MFLRKYHIGIYSNKCLVGSFTFDGQDFPIYIYLYIEKYLPGNIRQYVVIATNKFRCIHSYNTSFLQNNVCVDRFTSNDNNYWKIVVQWNSIHTALGACLVTEALRSTGITYIIGVFLLHVPKVDIACLTLNATVSDFWSLSVSMPCRWKTWTSLF